MDTLQHACPPEQKTDGCQMSQSIPVLEITGNAVRTTVTPTIAAASSVRNPRTKRWLLYIADTRVMQRPATMLLTIVRNVEGWQRRRVHQLPPIEQLLRRAHGICRYKSIYKTEENVV